MPKEARGMEKERICLSNGSRLPAARNWIAVNLFVSISASPALMTQKHQKEFEKTVVSLPNDPV
jgi:hypothetical protein